METPEANAPLVRITEMESGQLLAVATLVAAVLFGVAGVIGALGYLVAVARAK
ncbi:MAG: hypothetical protein Q8S43_01565 [Actinomycetota bacterium]|nr:MAG: hypothetical protein FD171_2170 [Actinomycetota bacterium]MDO8950088.1 hypothetical protein [Actinomycetota bacterium]MDP3629628.1 hypothetical protein [Actinomycetota bacterium]